MDLFQSILSQLKDKIDKDSSVTVDAAKIISDITKTTILPDQITIVKGVLRIKASPTLKMVLMLNNAKILKALQDSGVKIHQVQ
ncbi:MAG: hypothetical protein JWL92_113 [Candidatus Nomurabacteria bacterium]|nr:hypothetical protein [Candidatus Nomurabacteria bacterium]